MRVPSSTYRIQLRTPASDPDGRGVGFADVEAALPALAELGVGALYLSPVFAAVHGSTHGYDVVDPTRISRELGGPEALRSLRVEAKLAEIGLVVDLVPNHLGVAVPRENRWWWDVLALGPESEFFSFFDVDTDPDNGVGGAVALPVLGSPSDVDALEFDEVDGERVLRFYEHVFPLAPGTDEGTPQEAHARQHYRLVDWRSPFLGYRRFFTVTELAGLRQEDETVFERAHRGVAKLVREDLVDGVRVDHPDGLADPAGYLSRLRALVGPERWIVAEKILSPGEILEPSLPVEGTTGYDFLATLSHLFVSPGSEAAFDALAADLVGEVAETADLKREILAGPLRPEVRRLARLVARELGGGAAGTTEEPAGVAGVAGLDEIGEAVTEIAAATPCYRADYPVLAPVLPWAVDDAEAHRPELGAAVAAVAAAVARNDEASARLAQITGAATAKAEEDCRFYRLARLVALNEVGGNPEQWSLGASAFHTAMAARAVTLPLAMTTLGTHDTKRGEDVRARLLALTEFPEEWAALAETLRGKHAPPARDAGYFLLQNIVGVWPEAGLDSLDDGARRVLRRRLGAYATKALREAAVHTRWTDVDERFESAVGEWLDGWFGKHSRRLDALVAQVSPAGRAVSLAAKGIQLLAPGVPDVYQGTEVWDDSLVDPDNRRIIAYDGGVPGHPKTELVRCCLRLRRHMPEVFTEGDYLPLPLTGGAEGSVLAFARALRRRPGVAAHPQVVLVARLRSRGVDRALRGAEVALPDGEWRLEYGGPSGLAGGGDEHGDRRSAPEPVVVSGSLDAALLAASPVLVLVRE